MCLRLLAGGAPYLTQKLSSAKKIKLHLDEHNPMARVYQNVIFRNKTGIATISDEGAPPFRKHFAEM